MRTTGISVVFTSALVKRNIDRRWYATERTIWNGTVAAVRAEDFMRDGTGPFS